jgi:TatD DNase family protein
MERTTDDGQRMTDSHAHLNHEQLVGDADEVVARALAAGVRLIVNVGFDVPSSQRAVEQAERYDGVLAAVGIHPHDAKLLDEQAERELRELAGQPRVVAIGEVGLDFYRDLSPRPVQVEVFRRLLRLARDVGKPVIVHDREAHEDVLAMLTQERAGEVGVIMHCFSGDLEYARRCVEEGFYVGIAGPVTFGAKRGAPDGMTPLQQVAAEVPRDRLLIETDSPYLAPEPLRGRRNEPAYVRHVADKIAELRGISAGEVAEATTANLSRVLRL